MPRAQPKRLFDPPALRRRVHCGVPLLCALLGIFGPAYAGETDSLAVAKSHWAFQPVQKVSPPEIQSRHWARTPIDRFILARLEKAGVRPARPARPEVLLRRVYFDLIGLPPTPEQIDAFLTDRSPDAWTKVIDQLLASPHYGERWARHWLDVVRYAESDGFEHDAVRPNTWRYRDYVIASFNEDKPYDQFVQEQVAGDELWPDQPPAIIATAFHLLGPDMVDSADQVQRRLLTLSDMTDTTATTFLGLTMGCARCHDHKLEPFTQVDYYSLQAYFAPAQFHREWPVPTASERGVYEKAIAQYNARTGGFQKQLADLEQPYRERLREEKLAKMSEDVQIAHRTPRENRTAEQESSVLETAPQLVIPENELRQAMTDSDQSLRASLQKELKKVPKPDPLPQTLALQNTNGPAPLTHVLLRGDYNNPSTVVAPTVPAIFRAQKSPATDPDVQAIKRGDEFTSTSARVPDPRRRTALARWLTASDNPLTARVMVNRLWQHHFGRGLVETPNDFGTRGARPTHPELLDWLSAQFLASGWSVKAMHRLILSSAAYQQSSEAASDSARLDPDNHLLSHQRRVRLEGEVLRDGLLSISGQLNAKVGGPGVFPPIAADIIKTSKNWAASPDVTEQNRRSIYIFARRNLRFPFLEVFDAPDSNLSCPDRGQSTTAPQSLTMLNSREVMVAASETARLILARNGSDDERIDDAFRRILARRPTNADRKASRDFLARTRTRGVAATEPKTSRAHNSGSRPEVGAEWREFCRALFNLNDFVYVE